MTASSQPNRAYNVSKWGEYGKAIIAFIFVIWTIAAPLYFGDRFIDRSERIIILIAVLNNILIYIIPLNPSFQSIKTVVNALTAGAVVASTLIADGLQPDDWTIIIGAILTTLGVWYAPAASLKQAQPVVVESGFNK